MMGAESISYSSLSSSSSPFFASFFCWTLFLGALAIFLVLGDLGIGWFLILLSYDIVFSENEAFDNLVRIVKLFLILLSSYILFHLKSLPPSDGRLVSWTILSLWFSSLVSKFSFSLEYTNPPISVIASKRWASGICTWAT